MNADQSLIADQIVSLIKQHTRFGQDSIAVEREQWESLLTSIQWSSEISFSSTTSEGHGRLGDDVLNTGSQAALDNRLQQILSAEYAQLPGRLEAWHLVRLKKPVSQESSLTAAECFSGARKLGYAYQCGPCGGAGSVTCSGCRGRGKVTCLPCNGMGRCICTSCYGSGKKSCSYCNGTGTIHEQKSRQVINSNGVYITEYYTESRPCTNCSGGRVGCSTCSQIGSYTCFGCLGTGLQTCGGCGGSGRCRCAGCSGTGLRNRIATTTCSIRESYSTQLQEDRQEVQKTVSQWTYRQMLEFGAIRRTGCLRNGAVVTRQFAATVPLAVTEMNCCGNKIPLFGYGLGAKVLDFHNVVGLLLEEDLSNLHEALGIRWSWLPFYKQEKLGPSVASMISSDAHLLLCRSKEDRSNLTADGTVSAEYCDQAVAALKKAMGRLYCPGSMLVTCALMALTLLLGIVLFRFGGYLHLTIRLVYLVLVAVAAAVAVCGEWAARRRFSLTFAAEQQASALSLLSTTGTLLRWRIAFGIAATIGIVAGRHWAHLLHR